MIEALLICLMLLPFAAPFIVFAWLVVTHRRHVADRDRWHREWRKARRRCRQDVGVVR